MSKQTTRTLFLGSLLSLGLISSVASAAPMYTYTVTPASLPATLIQGSTAIPVTITVTNTAGYSFGLGAPTLGTDTNWQELSNTCNVKVALAKNASCVVKGVYNPLSASSNSVVYLNAAVSGNMTSHRPILSTMVQAGSGSVLTAAWTTELPSTSAIGNNYTAVLTVTNTGSTTATLGTPVWMKTPAADFPDAAASGTCGATLAASATCTYTETFKPLTLSTAANDKSLNVVVNYNTTQTAEPAAATTSTTKTLLIAVGAGPNNNNQSARIMTSRDNGATWATSEYDALQILNALTKANDQFLVVGDVGGMMTSSDGLSWTAQTSVTTNNLTAALWDTANYFVYGVDTTNLTSNLLTSLDGVTWAATSTSPGTYVFSALKRNATYVGLAIDTNFNTVFVTSTNGSAWTEQYDFTTALRATAVVPGQLIWTGSQYVMVGMSFVNSTFSGIIYTSPDGITWTGHTSGTTNGLNSINWNGTQYVVVGKLGTVLTSPDANTWTAQQSHVIGDLNKVTWDGSQYIAVGNGTIITSPDGIAWTTVEKGTASTLRSVAWNGAARYVAVGGSVNSAFPVVFNGVLVTSADGKTWSQATSVPTNFQLNSVAWGAGKFVAVGNSGTVLTSTDGLTWSQATQFTESDLNGITWSSTYNKFFVVGAGGVLLYSADGATWFAMTSGTNQALNSIVENGGRCVAVGTSTTAGESTTITSNDCNTNWSTTTQSGVNYFNKVIADGTAFVAVGSNGNIYSTTNGVTWIPHNFPTASYDLDSIVKQNSNYIVVGFNGITYVGTTLDSWTAAVTGNATIVNDLLFDGSQVVAVGDNGVILTTTNATTWAKANIFNLILYDIYSG
jgi:hypothetical protein